MASLIADAALPGCMPAPELVAVKARWSDHGAHGCQAMHRAFVPAGCILAAAQDIWGFSGCICNMPEIVEKSGMTGGNAKVALQD